MIDLAWWAAKWWIAVLFGAMVTGAKVLYNKHKKRKDAKAAEERKWREDREKREQEILDLLKLHSTAMIAVLYDRLNQAYFYFSERGYCTPQDRHNCLKMFGIYHDMGGNDNMEDIMEKLMDIPVKSDEKPI